VAAAHARAVGQQHGLDAPPLALQSRRVRVPVARAERDRLAPQAVHEGVRVEPAFTRQAQRAGGQVVARQPGKSRAQFIVGQQHDVGAFGALHAVVGLQHRVPVRRRQEQVARFTQADCRALPVHRQLLLGLAQEGRAEHRHADVFGGRELVPDRRQRTRRRALAVARVTLEHEHRSARRCLQGQEIGRRAAHCGTTDDHDVEKILHGWIGFMSAMAQSALRPLRHLPPQARVGV
jgi:hypothetical protein